MNSDQTIEGGPSQTPNAPAGGVTAFTSPFRPIETLSSIAGAARWRAVSTTDGGPVAATRPVMSQ